MSDEPQPATQPQPQSGEFWQHGNVRVYIIGRTLYGRLIVETRNGEVGEQVLSEWFHRVPNCTGFDSSPIDPGEGWELLPHGTVLQDEDECWWTYMEMWGCTYCAGAKVGGVGTAGPYRRRASRKTERVTMAKEQVETSAATHSYDVASMVDLGFRLEESGSEEWYVLRQPDAIRTSCHHRLRHSQVAWRPRDDSWQVNGLGAAGPGATVADVKRLIQMILG